MLTLDHKTVSLRHILFAMENKNMYYADYLQLGNILNSQHPESFKDGNEKGHDEMLFIIIHQAYELWFKQILFEVNSAIEVMSQQSINDNTPQLQTVVHRLNRVITILKVLVHQIDIMETMTPMDFLEFRDLLRPASGFQSWQFKTLEARLGLQYEERFGKEYYTSQLYQPEINTIKKAEQEKSLIAVVNNWLERMPYFDSRENWKDFTATDQQENIHPYWSTYRACYSNSLAEAERNNLVSFNTIFIEGKQSGQLSAKASRAALFIMLYRGYPIMHLPLGLINNLLEIDEQMSTYGIRGLEIDIYNDPNGGDFANRKINDFVNLPIESGVADLNAPGFKVLHIKDVDYNTHYFTFKKA